MQFISEASVKKDDESDGNRSDMQREDSPELPTIPVVRKPASACLLNSYRHTWKTTHNHFLRYSDVRPKDERRPTIMDLANQCKVLDKVNGWKIHHLSTQMLDLVRHALLIRFNFYSIHSLVLSIAKNDDWLISNIQKKIVPSQINLK